MKTSTRNDRLSQLEEKWANGTITGPEAIEYDNWYNQGQDEIVEIPCCFAASEVEHKARLFEKIGKEIEKRPIFRIGRVAAAAAVILAITGPLYFLSHQTAHDKATVARSENPKTVVSPGRTKASLLLANGQTVVLDSAADGVIAKQGSVNILLSHGRLAYEKQGHPGSLFYNTLITHNGEQYDLTLSDGTKVWLDAASTLRFPVAFTGGERRVELSGEAYFEVAKDAGKPFYVNSASQEIRVLGTHFNVNAYADERAIETTLLEGKIEVNKEVTLSPGEQAQLRNGAVAVTKNVDVDAAVAWKDGRFNFDNADVSQIMRQLERWYDIQVVFQGNKTTDLFYGSIPRSASLDQVLRILQNNRIHFELQGRRLVILP
jgi:transmembrane sensor